MAQELLRAVQENKMSELSQHLDKKSKQKMDTIEKSEQPYLKTSVWTLAKNRIVWLLILMISATVTGAIIQGFEDVLQSVVILASFIPMLMDTGGNSGSQSSTLIIRGLALGEITTKDIFKVIFKEFKVSIVVASILSVVNFLRLYFLTSSGFIVSLTVCASLFFHCSISKSCRRNFTYNIKKIKLRPSNNGKSSYYNNSRCLCINCLFCFCKITFRNIIINKELSLRYI